MQHRASQIPQRPRTSSTSAVLGNEDFFDQRTQFGPNGTVKTYKTSVGSNLDEAGSSVTLQL